MVGVILIRTIMYMSRATGIKAQLPIWTDAHAVLLKTTKLYLFSLTFWARQRTSLSEDIFIYAVESLRYINEV
jgi:hypothetical protein